MSPGKVKLGNSAGVARDAIELGATEIINIKPARVGGYLEAVNLMLLTQ